MVLLVFLGTVDSSTGRSWTTAAGIALFHSLSPPECAGRRLLAPPCLCVCACAALPVCDATARRLARVHSCRCLQALRKLAVLALAVLVVAVASQEAELETWASEEDLLDADINSPLCRNEFGAVVSVNNNPKSCAFRRVRACFLEALWALWLLKGAVCARLVQVNIKGTVQSELALPGMCDSNNVLSRPRSAYNSWTRAEFWAR